jgi:hypothetical protein
MPSTTPERKVGSSLFSNLVLGLVFSQPVSFNSSHISLSIYTILTSLLSSRTGYLADKLSRKYTIVLGEYQQWSDGEIGR